MMTNVDANGFRIRLSDWGGGAWDAARAAIQLIRGLRGICDRVVGSSMVVFLHCSVCSAKSPALLRTVVAFGFPAMPPNASDVEAGYTRVILRTPCRVPPTLSTR